MKKQKKHIISHIIDGSIAQELEIVPGDELVSINDQPVGDILDYRYLCNEEYLVVVIRKPDGEEWGSPTIFLSAVYPVWLLLSAVFFLLLRHRLTCLSICFCY